MKFTSPSSISTLSGIIASISLLSIATLKPASASSAFCLNGFQGHCAPENWTITTEGNGSVTFIGSPALASIVVSSDSNSFGNLITSLTTFAPNKGEVSFSYNYQTFDRDDASFDPFGYIVNGIEVQVVPPPFILQGESTSGSSTFNVRAGDIFGFYARATDDTLGPSVTTISNFRYVPGPLPILGVGAAFGYSRKLRNRIKSSRNAFTPIAPF
jgi:hypothetical protein